MTFLNPVQSTDSTKKDSFENRLTRQLLIGGSAKEIDINRATRMNDDAHNEESLVSLLLRLSAVSEQVMAKTIARVEDLHLLDKNEYHSGVLFNGTFSKRFLKDQKIVPISENEKAIELAVVDPSTDYPARALALASQKNINYRIGTWSDIRIAIENLYQNKPLESRKDGDLSVDYDVAQLRDMASEAPVISMVNQIIHRAAASRASDIHIEPFQNILKIRYRIDGVLQEEPPPPQRLAAAILSRIKIMANLDIAERRLPQDGRINLTIQGQEYDIRVSTVPTMFGESLVMRLLQRENVTLDFASLGMDEHCQRRLQQALDMPHGMIIVTGPTGSGKTTTLYTALSSLNTEERKIITVEDPIEYNLEGVNQIQVNPAIGLNFAGALRSIVRQDPDVIMVGEMRDLETAKICIQSALTGHLVLSTLHTNDAAGSITRLLEMGIEDYLLNSTLNLIVAQRLVRKICLVCRERYQASESQIVDFNLGELGGADPPFLYRAIGCESCSNTGYHGRFSTVELLSISDRIRKLISKHAGAVEIQAAAIEEGMKTMFDHACANALQGVTTIEEVIRVTREE